MDAQIRLWAWFEPLIKRTLSQNIQSDTIKIWATFLDVRGHVPDISEQSYNLSLQYMFYHEDPRRLQPLMDYIMNEFHCMDFNSESSFDAVKVLSLFSAVYEGLNWKFSVWIDDVLDHCWPQIHSEHDDVSDIILPPHHTTYRNCASGSCIYWRHSRILRTDQGINLYNLLEDDFDAFLLIVATQTFGAHSRGLRERMPNMFYRLRHYGYAWYLPSSTSTRAC